MSPFVGACFLVFASVYSKPQSTTSGEWFTGKELTMAAKDLKRFPLGSEWFVMNRGRSVPVRVNDWGPLRPNRDIDVSKRVQLDLKLKDLSWVEVCRIK